MPLLEREISLEGAFEAATSELRRAGVDRKHDFRFFTFSTFDGQVIGSRTVVLRAFDIQHTAWIYTDFRSAKVQALQQNPSATLLFYHKQKRAQVRITANVTIHHQDEVTATHWQKVQGDGQKAYLTKLAPSQPIDSMPSGWEFVPPSDENFAVLQCAATEIEVLQLDGTQHIRALFQKNKEQWDQTWLVA